MSSFVYKCCYSSGNIDKKILTYKKNQVIQDDEDQFKNNDIFSFTLYNNVED